MLHQRSETLPQPVPAEPGGVGAYNGDTFIASSDVMRRVREGIARAAEGDGPVLITGETGTGKETVARILHRLSHAGRRAIVVVDCAALSCDPPETDIFDRAPRFSASPVTERRSAFRKADGGALLVDNVDQLPLAAQARLVQALDRHSSRSPGGSAERITARVITTSRQDLASLVRDGRFREDLYDRLKAVSIKLPPLRDRLNDILPLAEHFLVLPAPGASKRLSSEAAARLFAYGWPGNVRELKNAMERVTVLVPGDVVTAADVHFLSAATPQSSPTEDWLAGDLPNAVARLETMLIRRALGVCHGNKVCAARALNIHRQLLYQKLKRYGFIDESASQDRRKAEKPRPTYHAA